MRAPDLMEEVVGWRAWEVKLLGPRRPVLYSVVRRTAWPTDQWLLAECKHGHEVPSEDCRCGIHAAISRDALDDLGYADDEDFVCVIGEVGLAGVVVPGTQGWRAGKARVRSLLVPHDAWWLVDLLAGLYRVPVTLANTLGPEEVRR